MATAAGRPVRMRDLTHGRRFRVVVSGKKVLVEVVFVRRRRFGDRRIVLRRVDTGRVLAMARSLDELLAPP